MLQLVARGIVEITGDARTGNASVNLAGKAQIAGKSLVTPNASYTGNAKMAPAFAWSDGTGNIAPTVSPFFSPLPWSYLAGIG